MDRRPDRPAADGRIAWPVMAGDEQHDAVIPSNRLLKTAVYSAPCAVQAHPMKVENAVGLDRAVAQSPIPAAVEGLAGRWSLLPRFGAPDLRRRSGYSNSSLSNWLSSLGFRLFARKRLNRGGYASPELGFLRAE